MNKQRGDQSLKELLKPPTKEQAKRPSLFKDKIQFEADWKKHWWGMPEFSQEDATPKRSINVNFVTEEDAQEFGRRLGVSVSSRTNSMWFPKRDRLTAGEFKYVGELCDSKYPICIPSKGRWDVQRTGLSLDKLGVSYRFFVEETEADKYREALGEDRVVEMPFHDLGKGSIPARNFIWDWAVEHGHKRHWVVDDNIRSFYRCNNNRRLLVHGGRFFQAMEEFVDRYSNVVLAGPHHVGFVPDREKNTAPFALNTRVYSCILIDTAAKYRWRGRYNEDTDLSLRVLKDGFCTLIFRALMMNKMATVGTVSKALKGGNTDNVYNTGDHRLAFAESLKQQHPDCVEVVWKFGRWHHQVDYSRFRQKLILKKGITPVAALNEYGMELVRTAAEDEEDEPEE